MRVLMICDNDPAGMAIAQAKAVNAYTEHEVRVVSTKTVYTHDWEKDLHVPDLDEKGIAELRDLLANADVFHFHMVIDENHALGPLIPRDFMAGKTIVHHHHGHHDFRGNPKFFQQKYAGLGRTNLLVSTPDLLRMLPGAVWQPNHVPVFDPRYMPLEHKEAAPVVLVHSPTRKDLKNTEDLLECVEFLRAWGVVFLFDLIDDVPHVQCLARKQHAHVAFDHLQGYYGVSSLETLSMGIPTVAGINDWNRRNLLRYSGATALPWVTASLDDLPNVLRPLLQDEGLRAAIGRESRAFMVDHFSDEKAAKHLAAFWEARCA